MNHPNKIRTSRYTAINFIPMSLYNQLRNPATCFFCVTLLMVCVPAISPFSPWSYMIAVLIVIGISMIKDGFEDYKKHQNDCEINEKRCHILREGRIVAISVMDLCAGDMLVSRNNEEIPADVVLLRTKSRIKNNYPCTNFCFINTMNLDGESNLKKKIGILEPNCSSKYNKKMNYNEKKNKMKSNLNNICEECINGLKLEKWKINETGDSFDEFDCIITLGDKNEYIVSPKNVLLRGSIVCNTEYVICGVLTVGSNTKLARSMEFGQSTTSIFKRRMDEILLIIGILYCIMLCGTVVCGVIVQRRSKYNIDSRSIGGISRLIFSNYILYSYLVPLSLYVMIEICRFTHALFIKHDQRMHINNIKSICHSSEVIEDMGMIDYVLTDKTGTITKNSMTLKAFHLAGENNIIYTDNYFNLNLQKYNNNTEKNFSLKNNNSYFSSNFLPFESFLIHLLVNNSVEVIKGQYEGVSQDELSFLKALNTYNYILEEREESFVKINLRDKHFKVCILYTVDFTSQRQNMISVIKINNNIFVLCKGSDHKLLCNNHEIEIREKLKWHSEYRLLVMKYIHITEIQLRTIFGLNSNAIISDSTDIITANSDSIIQRLDALIPQMHYQGATFIKDELQEDVNNTISLLRHAGMRIWMVTGDKRETAIACAYGSGIISESINLDTITHTFPLESSINSNYSDTNNFTNFSTNNFSTSILKSTNNNSLDLSSSSQNIPFNSNPLSAIACDGYTAINALENSLHLSDPTTAHILLHPAVIIYRATPYQKGKIAQLIVRAGKNVLAIGDGNNDVAMLRDATIGVGILGKEGTQASLAGDFAIPQFRLLKYLILYHGRYNLIRYSKIAINSYYKNLIFIGLQFFFNFFNAGSGKPIYNSFFMNYYNIIFTSLIPLVTALLDRDIEERAIFLNPETYAQARLYFSRQMIFLNIIAGFLQAATIFFVFYAFLYFDFANSTGKIGSYLYTSTFFSIVIFFATIIRQISTISFFTIYSYISILISISFFIIFILFVHLFEPSVKSTIYSIFIMPIFYFLLSSAFGIIFIFETIITLFTNKIISNFNKIKSDDLNNLK